MACKLNICSNERLWKLSSFLCSLKLKKLETMTSPSTFVTSDILGLIWSCLLGQNCEAPKNLIMCSKISFKAPHSLEILQFSHCTYTEEVLKCLILGSRKNSLSFVVLLVYQFLFLFLDVILKTKQVGGQCSPASTVTVCQMFDSCRRRHHFSHSSRFIHCKGRDQQ